MSIHKNHIHDHQSETRKEKEIEELRQKLAQAQTQQQDFQQKIQQEQWYLHGQVKNLQKQNQKTGSNQKQIDILKKKIDRIDPKLICKKCSRLFNSQNELQSHITRRHQDPLRTDESIETEKSGNLLDSANNIFSDSGQFNFVNEDNKPRDNNTERVNVIDNDALMQLTAVLKEQQQTEMEQVNQKLDLIEQELHQQNQGYKKKKNNRLIQSQEVYDKADASTETDILDALDDFRNKDDQYKQQQKQKDNYKPINKYELKNDNIRKPEQLDNQKQKELEEMKQKLNQLENILHETKQQAQQKQQESVQQLEDMKTRLDGINKLKDNNTDSIDRITQQPTLTDKQNKSSSTYHSTRKGRNYYPGLRKSRQSIRSNPNKHINPQQIAIRQQQDERDQQFQQKIKDFKQSEIDFERKQEERDQLRKKLRSGQPIQRVSLDDDLIRRYNNELKQKVDNQKYNNNNNSDIPEYYTPEISTNPIQYPNTYNPLLQQQQQQSQSQYPYINKQQSQYPPKSQHSPSFVRNNTQNDTNIPYQHKSQTHKPTQSSLDSYKDPTSSQNSVSSSGSHTNNFSTSQKQAQQQKAQKPPIPNRNLDQNKRLKKEQDYNKYQDIEHDSDQDRNKDDYYVDSFSLSNTIHSLQQILNDENENKEKMPKKQRKTKEQERIDEIEDDFDQYNENNKKKRSQRQENEDKLKQSQFFEGDVKIKVINTNNLPQADINGSSDPYIVASLGKEKQKMKIQKDSQTSTSSNKNNEELILHFDPKQTKERELKLELWDEDQTYGDDFIGALNIPV
ncbi:MAG: hypothetical protein EZS28_007587 [Streblomastix strix]|uniref:C2H2-type domain-containing protein n=1 Tax=Streblomastix strix TaxID=222440 RepID=A0A5J4WPM5_9EUKA|nr:MAG: hypothetical protein EZS28_007587 [Streblomastix strix]